MGTTTWWKDVDTICNSLFPSCNQAVSFQSRSFFWSHYVATLTFNLVTRPRHTVMPTENQIYANTQQQLDDTNFNFVADPGWSMQPAFDINLGEFMLDSEMQFLNNYFRKDGLGTTAPTLGLG
jgi:hypothetical protein